MTTWPDALHSYALHLHAADRSPGTIRLHGHYLRQIRATAPCPAHVTTDHLRRLIGQDGWSPETRKSCRGVARSFFSWAHAEGLIPADPSARLESISVPAGIPHPTPRAVIDAALAAAAPRERLMIRLGYLAGLRAAEIATIHSSRWDPWTQTLSVVGKGRKERVVPVLDDVLLGALRDLNGWLFPGRVDGHLAPNTVSKLLSQALPGDWTGHSLRHRCATAAYASTHDLLAVGALLGHSRPETTRRYVLVPDDALRAAVAGAAAA